MTNTQIKALCIAVWSYADRLTDAGRERSEAHYCGMYNLMRLTNENYIVPTNRLVRSINLYLQFLDGIKGDSMLMLPSPRQLSISFEDE